MSSTRPVAHGTIVSGRGDSGGPHRSRHPLTGWTLRRKLVASMLALFVIITLATSLLTIISLQRSLEADLDQRVVATAMRAERPDPSGNTDRRPGGLGGDFLLLVVSDGAAVSNIVYTVGGTQTALTTQQMNALASANLTGRPQTVDLGGDLGRYRLVLGSDGTTTLISGLPTAPLDESLGQLRLVTLWTGMAGLVLLGAGATYLVRINLRPLERVAATAARVSRIPLSSGDVSLAERVPRADTDERTEVGQVGSALNDLLDHVDESLRARHESETQLRHFVADAGRPLAAEPVDLSMLLVDAINDARVAGRDHTWRLDLPEETVEVVGDQARLTQVVVNLLANARVHTPPGTTVTGRVYSSSGTAVLEVEDDGPGIGPELMPHIFARFTRGDSARTRTGGSTGLGLSIAQAVATAHHGTIDVDSKPGRTVFVLRLPTAG